MMFKPLSLVSKLFAALPAFLVLLLLSACTAPGWQETAPPVPSEADLAKMAEATQQALENNKVGVSTNWSVEGSTHLGTATVTRTFEDDSGAPCREFQETVTIDGETQAAFGTACRDVEGNWTRTHYSGLEPVGPGGPYRSHRYPRYYGPGFGAWPIYGYGPYYRYEPRAYYGFSLGHGFRFRHHRHHYHRHRWYH